MKTKSKLILLITLTITFAVANTVSANLVQGFETNNNVWNLAAGQFTATRVVSGTHGITSHTGGYHAEAPGPYQLCSTGGSAYTNWGGYSYAFPVGGYITDVWVYLDIATDANNDTRFDWSSAINQPDCVHRRDFVFNGGFYNDSDETGSGPRFVISAGTNAGRCNSYPKNPGMDPYTITTSGWYKLEHQFDNSSGVLAVTMRLFDSNGVLLHDYTRSDSTDVIGTTVGGNRYGWFASQEFPFLAFDDSALIGVQNICQSGPGVGSQGYWQTHPETWCEQSIVIGGKSYTKTQATGNMRRATNKDMTYQLFAQLVAAELNLDCLNTNDSCVSAEIAAADAWLNDHPLGTEIRANSPEWQQIAVTCNTLASYNTGLLCAPPR